MNDKVDIRETPSAQTVAPNMRRTSRVREGLPYPLGATWDGLGVNFALFSANATKVELCLFDEDGRAGAGAHRAAGIHGRGLARLPAGCAARHGLRLPGARSLRARGGPPLQPEQAPARSLRQAARRRAALGPGAVRLHDRIARCRPLLRRARQRALHAEMPRRRPGLHLGTRAPAADPVGAHDHLRDACARLHHAASGRAARSCAAPSPGCAARGDRLHPQSSASPRSSCCRSTPSSTTAT